MHVNKVWVCKDVQVEEVERISKEAGISTLLSKIFLSRGQDNVDFIKKFLHPVLQDLHSPLLLKDMDKAVSRIIEAIRDNEKIIIYGDYDVDGITSTSILYNFLKSQKAEVDFYIPDRMDEGYGLSIGAIDKISQMGTNLIITVDCGITALDEVNYINENNIDVIITDHHKCKDNLPDGCAVIDPHRPDCTYPFKELAGVGVVYKLINALCIELELGDMHNEYLDMVALGTVADVVPLIGENRIIVRHGLAKIESTSNIGIKTLISISGLKDKPVNSWGISFVIAPRINAAGRIGDAGRGVKLFNTKDENEAMKIAEELNDENKFRQDTETTIFQQAVNFIETKLDIEKEKILVVDGDEWHHGVIGIVASKITERYYRPCILISKEEGIGKASGRSIAGFDLFKALSHCEGLLERFGGHELAAGLSLKVENIPEFRTMINLYADKILTDADLIPKVKIDVRIDSSDISINSVKELEELAPFGAGNPGPVFAYNNFTINEIRTVGDDKHLKLRLADERFFVDAIGFNMGRMINTYNNMDILDVACSLEINSWKSTERVQLNLKDIKPNNEMIADNNYYFSLDKCLDAETLCNSDSTFEKLADNYKKEPTEKIIDALLEVSLQTKSAVILINSMESAKQLEGMLKKSPISIKIPYKICYTNYNNKDVDITYIIVNPDADEIEFSIFDRILFFGEWISKSYLGKLLKKIDNEKVIIFNDNFSSPPNTEEIIPERKDLIAVYQYIKARCANQLLIEDLHTFSKKIAQSYKIYMNFFKVKKCIEIFEELGLLEKEPAGDYGMFISALSNSKIKTDLENSMIYKSLQALKTKSCGA